MSFTSRSLIPAYFLLRSDSYSQAAYSVAASRQSADQQSVNSANVGEEDRPVFRIRFEPLATTPIFWVQIICSIIVTITGLVYGYYGCYINDQCAGYYTMLYLRGFFWVVTYMAHLFVKSKHNRLKLLGYHKFLRAVHKNKKFPLQLVSLCNLLILLTHTILSQVFGSRFFLDCHVQKFPMTLGLSIICLFECVILIISHFSYFVMVNCFNAMKSAPDAMVANRINRSSMNPEDFINQQFLMVVRLMEENRHLQDKIREAINSTAVMYSESTTYSHNYGSPAANLSR